MLNESGSGGERTLDTGKGLKLRYKIPYPYKILKRLTIAAKNHPMCYKIP